MKVRIQWIRSVTFSGFIKFIKLKLTGKSLLVTGSCKGCGKCCRRISLEGGRGWIDSKKEYNRIINKNPNLSRFKHIGEEPSGIFLFTCEWLDERGGCKQHDRRLELCKRYPEKSLVFAGGVLNSDCGYSFKEVKPFNKILTKEMSKRK